MVILRGAGVMIRGPVVILRGAGGYNQGAAVITTGSGPRSPTVTQGPVVITRGRWSKYGISID